MRDNEAGTIVIEIAVSDGATRARLHRLLSDVTGLRIARSGETADVTLTSHLASPNLPPAAMEPDLTAREIDVLMLLAEGASNKEIASRLGISPHTAKFHVGRLIDKLDATGRTDAVAQAARIGVIHL